MAEREGFEPPIGLHLCRISSAVHSTTLPPLQAPWRAIHPLAVGACSRRGRRARQGAGLKNFQARADKNGAKTTGHLTVRANCAARAVQASRGRAGRSVRAGQSQRSSKASAGAQQKGGAARRDKIPAAPCRFIEILPGSAASPVSRSDRATVARRAKSTTQSGF